MKTQQELGAARDEKIAAEYRARNAVRVLDVYTRKHAYPFGENDYTVKCSGTGDVWRVLLGSWEFPAAQTPDAARIAAAEALLKDDPSLGEGP